MQLMQDLNVQLDNLCQVHVLFSPMDKASHLSWRFGTPVLIRRAMLHKRRARWAEHGVLPQFLPQDRVQSFAQMTPKQMLEESERALADGKYYQLHQELVEESKDLENIQRVRKLCSSSTLSFSWQDGLSQ